jgi:hypothetical protein
VAVTPAPLRASPAGHGSEPPPSPISYDASIGRRLALDPDDSDVDEPAPKEIDAAGPDLPGSADLASALGSLGSASRATRRRKTAAGLPTGTAAPPPAQNLSTKDGPR